MPLRLPALVHLPSGLAVHLEPPAAPLRGLALLGLARAFVDGQVVVRGDRGGLVEGGALALADFHVLRAVLTAAGHLDEAAVVVPCVNCGELVRAAPCAALELGPYLDGELDDDYLDIPPAFGQQQPLPSIPSRNGPIDQIVFSPVSLRDALPLFEALSAPGSLRVTSAVVRAMGIAKLGDEEHPGRIARALARADDEAWAAVVDGFEQAHYAPRMDALVRCGACGARNAIGAPAEREFPIDTGAMSEEQEPRELAGFPGMEVFEATVERVAGPIFGRKGVRNVGLVVEGGVAACDDGGVPLLGSYEPPVLEGPGQPAREPEITLYFRTFRAMYAEDGPYDVEGEITETIEHELEHHLAYLSGDDPLDDEERGEIAREERRLVGETESLRRAARATRVGAGDFLYRTWPLWLIGLLGALATALGERLRALPSGPSRRTKSATMRTRLAHSLAGLLAAATVLTGVTAQAGPDDTIVAKVGPLTLTKGELERRLARVPGIQLATFGSTPEEVRRAFVDKVLVTEMLFSLGAREKKLDAREDIRIKIQDTYRQALLTSIRRPQGDAVQVTPEEIERYYADNRDKYQTPERLQVWRILVASKDEAQKLIDEVRKPGGEKRWKDLAREKSTDKATSDRGGDLGFVAADGKTAVPTVRVEPALFEAAKKVQNGEIVPEPVPEGKAWAVVWRRGATPAVTRPIELEAGSIRSLLVRQKIEGTVKETLSRLRTELVSGVSYDLLNLVEIGNTGEVSPRKKPGVVKTKAPGKPQPTGGPGGLR
jgi:parvulin-like peptidyl-prolyl isomerase